MDLVLVYFLVFIFMKKVASLYSSYSACLYRQPLCGELVDRIREQTWKVKDKCVW